MLNPDRVPVPDDGRNPFFLGEFEGCRVRRVRLLQTVALALAIASGCAAVTAVYDLMAAIYAPSACVVSAVDWSGNEYVVGQGDTLADAMTGAVLPPNPRDVYVVEGCDR